MTSEIASMLDELMGRNRNDTTGKATAKLEVNDPDVCQFYLCGFCPNELFVNTKADLGPCKKIHDENLRREYQASDNVFKMGFEEKFFDFLQECMIEVERKIKRNKQRLDQNQDEDAPINAETAEHANKLSLLSIEITNLLVEVERLGELGEVQQAMAKTEEVEKLKEERERIRLATKVNANPDQAYHGQQEKQMEVCEICGSFLIVGDSRVDDHLTGKQHMGNAAKEEIEAPQTGRANAVTTGNEECRVNDLLDVNLVVMNDDTRGTTGDVVAEKETIGGDETIETDEIEDVDPGHDQVIATIDESPAVISDDRRRDLPKS
ncbi:Oidioi.mRNA.OKI2018_I69.XSR.g15931.t1.cds [Oikopleura dioica]|uniref:Oidioi.mRNA.OKI2018_I69.XSR.g15931.t1.cds n=1 Tax=Oikopleura dioica TaxID=34765 RepID=A0ABN7SGC5_OIKDI|nr:Oidioi.mRNA.OKI2018_I69.XSR.g15931.t1.cds [Oikopleura dioica]